MFKTEEFTTVAAGDGFEAVTKREQLPNSAVDVAPGSCVLVAFWDEIKEEDDDPLMTGLTAVAGLALLAAGSNQKETI